MGVSAAVNPLHVEKRRHLVHLYLTNGVQVKGSLHVAPRVRLTDTMNFQAGDKPFLPVTNVQIITQSGKRFSVPFMVINRRNIISCIPQERTEG